MCRGTAGRQDDDGGRHRDLGATCRDDLDRIPPKGRIRYALIATLSESQSRELIRVAAGMVEARPVLRSLATIRADEILFDLPSGAKTALRALPANPRSVRGLGRVELAYALEHGVVRRQVAAK